jgi:hypothetical protein
MQGQTPAYLTSPLVRLLCMCDCKKSSQPKTKTASSRRKGTNPKTSILLLPQHSQRGSHIRTPLLIHPLSCTPDKSRLVPQTPETKKAAAHLQGHASVGEIRRIRRGLEWSAPAAVLAFPGCWDDRCDNSDDISYEVLRVCKDHLAILLVYFISCHPFLLRT